MFGFERLAALAGRFEHAAKVDRANLLDLIPALTATIHASLAEMRLRAPVRTTDADMGRNSRSPPVIQRERGTQRFRLFGSPAEDTPCLSDAEGN
jgi:hypothetical protein